MKNYILKSISIISFTILLGILISCSNKEIEEENFFDTEEETVVNLTPAQYKNAGIEIGEISSQNIASILKVNGKIDVPPQGMVSVSVPLGGYLKSSNLLTGMHVKKGQVLAVIEDVQYIQLQQDYLTAKAQFELYENEYQRQRELNLNKAASDKVYEQAKANYETQNILIKSLEQKLLLTGLNPERISPDNISKSINIYSPITGYVSQINVNVGKFIDPSDILFELVNPSNLHLTLSVFEKDVNKLEVGQTLFAYTNTHPDKKYICKIVLISRNLNSQNAVDVMCRFEQYDHTLLPGMFMNGEIELTAHQANALPNDAVLRFDGKKYVFVVTGKNQFEMQEVQIGDTENGYTEIHLPAKLAGKSFVTQGAYSLLMVLKNTSED